jgi:hypothetical protein
MTKFRNAQQKSVEDGFVFHQDFQAGMPGANRAQSGSERVVGNEIFAHGFRNPGRLVGGAG